VGSRRLSRFRDRLLFRILRLISGAGRRIPLPLGRAVGRVLGSAAWLVVRRERAKALRNVGIAFPELDEAGRRTIVRRMFRHLGETLFEVLWLPNLDRAALGRTTTVEHTELVDRALQGGSGLVVFTAHCGNWEWLAATVSLCGYGVTALQRERDDRGMNDFIIRLRQSTGVETIDRGSPSSGRDMLRALRSGRLLAFLIDQNIRGETDQVLFFGHPALTPTGPARLAIRAGVPVIAGFIERRGGRLYAHFEELVETSRNDDPLALTQRMTDAIERQIRRAPEQWVWMHDRWKQRGANATPVTESVSVPSVLSVVKRSTTEDTDDTETERL
jgi:KDO2-lipid IV(A) lauroyltransferase